MLDYLSSTEKIQLLRCAAFFPTFVRAGYAVYRKYFSFLRICVPCL